MDADLISLECDPQAYYNEAIQLASEEGDLVSVGCDPKAYTNFVIRWASLEVVKYLLKFGCDHETVMLHTDIKYLWIKGLQTNGYKWKY